jgi:WD40 repeat protein
MVLSAPSRFIIKRGQRKAGRYITRVCAAVLAGLALAAVGVTAASASTATPRTLQTAKVTRAGTALATTGPGTQQWVKRYNGPAGGLDDATSVAASPDGSTVYVTGFSTAAGASVTYDYATVAYNAVTGHQLWAERYNGPGNGDDRASSVAVSPDGSTVYVTGYSTGATSGADYATVAYNATTGAPLWIERYNGPGNYTDEALSAAVSPDGSTVYVTGYSDGLPSTGSDYATVAYNATTGAQQWVKRYNGGVGDDYAHSVAVSGSTVYVTGYSRGTNDAFDYATVAYGATGQQLWVKRYNGAASGHRGANAVAVSPDGKTVFVTGSSYRATTNYDYATVAYNAATGAQQWVSRYTGPGNGDDQANSVAVNPDGNSVYITGYISVGNVFDYATIAYNAATGTQQWVQRYNGPFGDNEAFSVAVSPSGGTVYVTGSGDANSYYATVAYNAATGAQQWLKRYTGPGPDGGGATWAAVSPTTGTVYVTGFSSGNGTGNDYATVAYQG